MITETRTIELTIRSATDLKNFQKFGKEQKCYAVAYIYTAQRQATGIDFSRGINPIWDAPLTLTVYESDLRPDGRALASASSSSSSSGRVLTIEIYCKSSGYFSKGDKHVGTVVVPLQYIASAASVERLAMTFDVHRPSKRLQGKLNMTVKLGEKQFVEDHSTEQMPSYSYYDKVEPSAMMPPIAVYNVATRPESTEGVYHDSKYGAGVVESKYRSEVVTGYPATGPAFAPLGQLPFGNESQVAVGQPFVPGRSLTRKERRKLRRAQKPAMDPLQRKARNRRRRNVAIMIIGGIVLGTLLL